MDYLHDITDADYMHAKSLQYHDLHVKDIIKAYLCYCHTLF